MRIINLSLRVIGVLLVLAVGAVVVFANLVDPNEYKPQISALVKQSTGRELTLHGDLQLAFFPWLGVKTGRVELANGKGFGAQPMISAAEVAIKIKLLPLLKKRVELDTVRLNKPQIRLSRKVDGSANWDDLTAKITTARHEHDHEHDTTLSDTAFLAGLVVQGIAIDNGRVEWDDRSSGQTFVLRALNLDSGMLLPGEPLAVNLSAIMEGNMLPTPAMITLATTVRLMENLESIAVQDTDIRIVMEHVTADFSVENITYALRAGLAALVGLRGSANHAGISTTLKVPALTFIYPDESLRIPRLDLEQTDFFLTGSVNSNAILSDIAKMTLDGDVDVRIEDVRGLLVRNNVTSLWLPGLVNSVEVGFQFNLAGNDLMLSDLIVASLEKPGGELLLNQKAITIPLRSDNTTDYRDVFAAVLRDAVKKKWTEWLYTQIAPSDDDKENESAEDLFQKSWKEKIKKRLLKTLDAE